MDNKFQTSFIPQRPIVTESGSKSSGINLLLLISVIVFVVSVLSMVGFYLWQKSLKSQIKTQSDQLVELQRQTEKNTINSLISLDDLLKTSDELLKKHVAISPLFQFLQSNTITDVRFKNFSFSYGELNKISVKMSGVAKDFNTIAAQTEAFNKAMKKGIVNPIFSDFSPQADGTVSFNFSADLDPALINYYSLKGGSDDNNSTTNSTPIDSGAVNSLPSNF
jgi:Tfp pilus assembly protein PilV